MESDESSKKSLALPIVIFALGIAYTVSPVDLIPDIPVIGWVDDFFVFTATLLNLLEEIVKKMDFGFASIVKWIKWILILLGVIVVLLLIFLGSFIVKWLT